MIENNATLHRGTMKGGWCEQNWNKSEVNVSPLLSIVGDDEILAPDKEQAENSLIRRYCEWIRDRLLVRDDAFVTVDRSTGVPWKKTPLTAKDFIRHACGIQPMCMYAIGHDDRSKWVAWDFDNHDGDGETYLRNTDYVLHLAEVLRSRLGFDPLVESSDGRGGFHVWVLFDDFIPSWLAHQFAGWVIDGFCDWRPFLTQAPECIPKQPCLTETRRFGSALRVPGRHPTRNAWSAILNKVGERWIPWPEAVEAIITYTGDSAKLIPDDAQHCRVPPRSFSQQDRQQTDDERLVTSIAEYFDLMRTWESVLEPRGWEIIQVEGQVTYWRRPGKWQPGHSATTGYCGDKLFVFSHNAKPFEAGRAYTKFHAFTLLEHDGDADAAEGDIFNTLIGGIT